MTESRLLEKLRSRIRSAWDDDPLFIDPIVEPGLTANQLSALRRAADETEKSGIPYFIAIVPKMRDTVRSRDVWDRFTADLAFRVHEAGRAEQSIVLFTMAESSAKTFAYVVDDNGPAMPPDSAMFARSASDDFLPLELSVPHHLRTLVATAQGRSCRLRRTSTLETSANAMRTTSKQRAWTTATLMRSYSGRLP